MPKFRILGLAIVGISSPALALAHPGHGHTDPNGLLHYLTEPVHVVQILAAAGVFVGFIVATQLARHRELQRKTITLHACCTCLPDSPAAFNRTK